MLTDIPGIKKRKDDAKGEDVVELVKICHCRRSFVSVRCLLYEEMEILPFLQSPTLENLFEI